MSDGVSLPVTWSGAARDGVMSSCCPVVELRQYTLRHGQRDVLIELFDREFIESQEAVGMELIGQFRDLDRPERFVWMRGFPDMQRRREALEAFYGGPVWKTHAAAANATMVDVDDVLLLRPIGAVDRIRASASAAWTGRRRCGGTASQ